MRTALFISDLHLSAERPEITALLLRFLREQATAAEKLFILGDLFDVWIGDDNTALPIPEVIAGLRSLNDQGVSIQLIHGNRDFLIGDSFCKATGCTLLPDPCRIELGGVPTLLMHGDLLCTDDVAYQQMRIALRSPQSVNGFLALPIQQRAAIAADIRKKSGEATSLLPEDITDANAEAVNDYLRRFDASQLIHGHTHRPALHRFDLDGRPARRYVLPQWDGDYGGSGPGYLRADGEALSVHSL